MSASDIVVRAAVGDPAKPCVDHPRPRLAFDIDLKSPAMHTSRTCLFDIVAVLTPHPQGHDLRRGRETSYPAHGRSHQASVLIDA